MRIEDLVAEATEQDEASFALAYPDPLLIGAGLVLTDLPDPDGEGTLMLGTDDQDLQVLEQSRAIGGRVFWIRPAAGGRLKVGPAHRATLGRERHNDVVLPDFPVSSVHCWERAFGVAECISFARDPWGLYSPAVGTQERYYQVAPPSAGQPAGKRHRINQPIFGRGF